MKVKFRNTISSHAVAEYDTSITVLIYCSPEILLLKFSNCRHPNQINQIYYAWKSYVFPEVEKLFILYFSK